ncbi:UPF0125 protein RatB [hydrothermal vent metagenome]|uniref:UPF0125 protein RatB n=1 Tax=hydrothermal vent metagenome TaxID=652676 RepID=A0A3B1BTY2_9ZZZZ
MIEVAYAKPEEQVIVELVSTPNMTVHEAIEQSGIMERFPEIDLAVNKVGIFSKAVKLDSLLSAGDRVEIYRPLLADPKEARRQRAATS